MRILFCDIDDTMTTRGLLPRETFDALWDAKEAGLRVVPVTGRPAGWCDMIARQWPVDGVVGENGAFYFRKVDGKIVRVHCQTPEERAANRKKLEALRETILREVPGCAIASDQAYREYDLAVDFCESVPRLPRASIDRIVELFRAAGATAKVSSIHVNGWFGAFDKRTMVRRYIAETMGEPFEAHPNEYAFVGDSPNDEPMWEAFPESYAVANVEPFLPDLTHPPAHIVSLPGGAGFAQVVAILLGK